MEYYDDVNRLLNEIAKTKGNTEKAKSELMEIFMSSSAKELFLIVSEWMALSGRPSFTAFIEILPFHMILIKGLKKASPLISQDLITALYQIIAYFNGEQIQKVSEILTSGFDAECGAGYVVLLALVSPTLSEEQCSIMLANFLGDSSEISTELHRSFFALPIPYQLSYSRCALFFHDKMRSLSLERLALLLLDSPIAVIQQDGIKLASIVKVPSAPKKLFHAVLTKGPYMPTIDGARDAWKGAEALLDSFNDQDKYHVILEELQSYELPESSRAALTHKLLKEISANKSGIFRSPMAGHFVTLVMPQDYVMSPVGKTESVLTALNFIKCMLLLDRKNHCFNVMGNPEPMQLLEKMTSGLTKSLKRAETDNERSNEAILNDMKKVSLGKAIEAKDIDGIKAQTRISIARIKFILMDVVELLKH